MTIDINMFLQKKNFTEDGKISKELRTGKYRTDAYYKRSKFMLQKGREIQSITGCEALVDLIPTWPEGKRKTYKSKDYPYVVSQTTETSNTGERLHCSNTSVHITPQKSMPSVASIPSTSTPAPSRSTSAQSQRVLNFTENTTSRSTGRLKPNPNICSVCKVEYGSKADKKLSRLWVQCAKNCDYWVQWFILHVVTYIIRIALFPNKIWRNGLPDIFSVKSTCPNKLHCKISNKLK